MPTKYEFSLDREVLPNVVMTVTVKWNDDQHDLVMSAIAHVFGERSESIRRQIEEVSDMREAAHMIVCDTCDATFYRTGEHARQRAFIEAQLDGWQVRAPWNDHDDLCPACLTKREAADELGQLGQELGT